MKKIMSTVKEKSLRGMIKLQTILADNRGETFIDTAIKILISVVMTRGRFVCHIYNSMIYWFKRK